MAPHRVAAGALVSSLLRLRNGSRVLQPLERALGGLRVRPLTSGTPYNAVTVGVPKESYPGERRVAITPASVAALIKARCAPPPTPRPRRERTRRMCGTHAVVLCGCEAIRPPHSSR